VTATITTLSGAIAAGLSFACPCCGIPEIAAALRTLWADFSFGQEQGEPYNCEHQER
jgi:hypothetical protein